MLYKNIATEGKKVILAKSQDSFIGHVLGFLLISVYTVSQTIPVQDTTQISNIQDSGTSVKEVLK